MQGRVCLVTGANRGIGKATALGLAELGARVVLICRDRNQGESATTEIRSESGNDAVELLLADLSSQGSIRQLVQDITNGYPQVHVLVNNAGLFRTKRHETEGGIELTLAVNYLAPFLLTNLLIDTLKAGRPSRIVNVAGDYHRKGTIDFEDLMCEKDYSGSKANNQAKLALVLFTYEMARRLAGIGVTVNCLHPGAVATDGIQSDPDISAGMLTLYRFMKLFFATPKKGAETSIYLASSPDVEGVTGKYFIKKKEVASSPESYDESIAKQLWEVSEGLTGMAYRE
ncbi:MAG: SDR family NAD(P)-dependent oxidoreductase [Anaerolineales bacterium]|nr:SDR family NAD(P)-dependent oxidoreductase [Anaerolineales bacterium]